MSSIKGTQAYCFTVSLNMSPKNKRDATVSLLETMIVSSFVFIVLMSPVFKNKPANHLKIVFNTSANFYLDFCSSGSDLFILVRP